MQCQHCGAEVNAAALFCHQCGVRLKDREAEEEMALAADETQSAPRDRFVQAAAKGHKEEGDDAEHTLWEDRYSGKAMIGVWIGAGLVTLVALIAGVLFVQTGPQWGIVLGVIVVVWIALALVYLYRRYSVHYTLTNHRFVHEHGLLWRVIDRLELIDVSDITFRQGPVARMLNVGTIDVSSSDHTHPNLSLPGIDDVRTVAGIIDRQRREERRRRGLHIHQV